MEKQNGVARKRTRAIGEKLRSIRKQQGLSQQALADIVGVSKVILNGWETGRGVPRLENLWATADALGILPGDLLPNAQDSKEKADAEAINQDYITGLLAVIPVAKRAEFLAALRVLMRLSDPFEATPARTPPIKTQKKGGKQAPRGRKTRSGSK